VSKSQYLILQFQKLRLNYQININYTSWRNSSTYQQGILEALFKVFFKTKTLNFQKYIINMWINET